MYFLGVRGLTTSSYIVYDYNTSGHMDVYIMDTQYIHISVQHIYLFLMQ
jgi:hypothetical protein